MAGEKADDAEASVISYDEYGGGRMILDGSPKLVDRSDGPSEFYDLNEHPTEAVNLAGNAAHMSVESDLRSTLRDWFAANENAVDRAWERRVGGRGQIQPPCKGLDDDATYVQRPVTSDRTRKG